MRFLSLYTPAVAPSGPPSAEHMAQMGAYMEEMFKAGVLIDTGGILKRSETGMRATLTSGKYAVAHNPPGASVLLDASGWAILQASSKEELQKHIETFLRMAGEGTCEIIQLMDAPPT